jgi:hypothetical protein
MAWFKSDQACFSLSKNLGQASSATASAWALVRASQAHLIP